MKKWKTISVSLIVLSIITISCKKAENQKTIVVNDGNFIAYKTQKTIVIDEKPTEQIWKSLPWFDMNHKWMGEEVDSLDYYGRFKLAWNKNKLFILVNVTDEYLHETLSDGKENYWKGDYVEVFIDEDASGGDHKFNHQAFAYHVTTEGHSVEKNTQQQTMFFDDHIEVKRTHKNNTYTWEIAVQLFDNTFDERTKDNTPVKIFKGKKIGFSIAYGDNDGKQMRENFMGSKQTHGINNDEGYINSSVFGSILFKE